MKWLLTYLTSSIGKKQVMGATGCMLVLFVLGHMVGNLQLLLPDPAAAQVAYNTYSALLTKSKLFLYSVESGLAVIFVIHMYLAITLKLQNLKARGSARYAVEARKGKKQFPTFIMIWSGLSIIAFIVWHIATVRNGVYYYYINPEVADGKVVRDMWLTTVEVLGDPLFAMLYISVMALLGFHMWHAISSAFQTMGINHQKWTPIIDKLGIVYCVVVAFGFGITAIGSWVIVNLNEDAKKIIEQVKDPNYQKALETLSAMPLDEQKAKSRAIAKNPKKAKLIVEREHLLRSANEHMDIEGLKRMKFRDGEGRMKFRDDGDRRARRHKNKDGAAPESENTEPQLEAEPEAGGEQ
jgi:succinate dehydrogenase / fumarate reductase cytochrome b subunit